MLRHKSILLFFFFLIICFSANAQYTFVGRVTEEGTDKPIQYASVYINNSTQGGITDNDGSFSFSSSIPIGELIITSVGYFTLSYPFNKPIQQKLLIKLTKRDNTLDEVMILSSEERLKYLNLFKENFLGITEEATNSKIKNIKDIYFIKNADNSEGFTAKADSSLVIINKSTGYKITFTLEGFSYNASNQSTFFYGFTKYDDLVPFKRKYISRRRQIFEGSTMQFYRSLTDNSSTPLDFSMMEIEDVKINGRTFQQGTPKNKNQLLRMDSADNNVFYLTFKKQLRVQYAKTTKTSKYLSSIPFRSTTHGSIPISTLILIDSNIIFDKNGVVYNPLGLLYSGYWSFEKVANMLPSDYKPSVELK